MQRLLLPGPMIPDLPDFPCLKKKPSMGKQRCCLTPLVRPFDVRFAVANPVSHSGSEWILGLSDYHSYQP